MDAYLLDWLSLLLRWTHLIVGIAWIGASFYFVWLDNHLLKPADPQHAARGVAGELWAVHGGGFYHAQKYQLAPPQLPATLHWFYWEAYSTFLSGIALLALLYWLAPQRYLIDPAVLPLAAWQAVALGAGALLGGWLVYDGLCRSPLAARPRLLALAIGLLVAAAAWGLCAVFSGRGAYLHFGALLGTIMVANVFFVIIPGQRRAVAAMREGRAPEPRDGLRGKQRSLHNTYFTLPVLLAMISNHYALLYGAEQRALALIGIAAAGAAVRAWFVARHKAHERGGRTPVWPLLLAAVLLLGVLLLVRPLPVAGTAAPAAASAVPFATVRQIVEQRCVGCHAARPSFPGFAAPPLGLRLDDDALLQRQAPLLRAQLAAGTMPLGNVTGMSADERQQLLDWIDQGAPR